MIGLALLSAHLLADFPFQSDEMADKKIEDHFVRFVHAGFHGMITFLFTALIIEPMSAFYISMLVLGAHWIIDSRRWVEPKEDFELYPVVVDQTMHVTSLFLIAVLVLG